MRLYKAWIMGHKLQISICHKCKGWHLVPILILMLLCHVIASTLAAQKLQQGAIQDS